MAAITACAITPDKNFIQILETLSEKLEQPFFITYAPYTFKCILIFTAAYFLGIGIYESQKEIIEEAWNMVPQMGQRVRNLQTLLRKAVHE